MFCGVSQLYPDVKTFKMKLYALKLLVIGTRKERMSTNTLHLHEYLLPDQFSKLVTKYEHLIILVIIAGLFVKRETFMLSVR